jgi:hypothetical protein
MRLPFPNTRSRLAMRSHMYICLKDGTNKTIVKCQSEKPTHLISSNPPFRYVREEPNIDRNPFNNNSLIDCDKTFSINDVRIDTSLLTTIRKDICDDLLEEIYEELDHPDCRNEDINTTELVSLNELISPT